MMRGGGVGKGQSYKLKQNNYKNYDTKDWEPLLVFDTNIFSLSVRGAI